MASNYFLTSSRLGFRYWEAEDLPLAEDLWGEREVIRYATAAFWLSPEARAARLRQEISTQEQFGIQHWPFFLTASGQLMGACGFQPYDLKQQICQLGFYFYPRTWESGLAIEAVRAVINFAFDFYEMRVLIAGHHPEDLAALRLLKQVGFRYAHDAFYRPTGLYHPTYQLFSPKS